MMDEIYLTLKKMFQNIVLNMTPPFLLHKTLKFNQWSLKISFLIGILLKEGNQLITLIQNYNIILKFPPHWCWWYFRFFSYDKKYNKIYFLCFPPWLMIYHLFLSTNLFKISKRKKVPNLYNFKFSNTHFNY